MSTSRPPRNRHHLGGIASLPFLLTTLLLVLCAGAARSQETNDAQQLLAHANEALQAGQLDAARAAFNDVLAIDAGSLEALNGLANLSLYLKDYDRAEDLARQLLAAGSDDPAVAAAAQILLGTALYQQLLDLRYRATVPPTTQRIPAGNAQAWRDATLQAAEQAFRGAIELGTIPEIRLSLAEILRLAGRDQEALEALDDYLSQPQPKARLSAENLRCYLRAEDPESAASGVTRPRPLRLSHPEITAEAREAGIEGTVFFEGVVGTDGVLDCLRVVRGLPMGLNQAALTAARQWRFKPAEKGGAPARARYAGKMSFQASG